MIDREALAAALDEWGITFAGNETQIVVNKETRNVLRAAARERLAQLPETCGTCGGKGIVATNEVDHKWETCPRCRGRGTVYPPALVERIAKAIEGHAWGDFGVRLSQKIAVAVLDALNTEPL